jgi:hypothetical protein
MPTRRIENKIGKKITDKLFKIPRSIVAQTEITLKVFRLHQQQATTRTQNLKVLSTNRHHCATGAAKVMSSRLSWLRLSPKSVTLFIVSYEAANKWG